MQDDMPVVGSQIQPGSPSIMSSGYKPRLLGDHIEQEVPQVYSSSQRLGGKVERDTCGKRDIDVSSHGLQVIRARPGQFTVKKDITICYSGFNRGAAHAYE